MADDMYVLDLLVTGADAVFVIDDGTGIDTIRVNGLYAETVVIDLAWAVISDEPLLAGSMYYSADGKSRALTIFGTIENACGSRGSDSITGNSLANLLCGDQKSTGPGLSDSLQGGGGDDSLFGGAGSDLLWGGTEDDLGRGDAGDDLIDAGSGRDTVAGGSGADVLDGGGDAGDTLSYADSRRGVVVALQDNAVTLARGGDAQGDQITGFTDVIGSRANDRITMVDRTAAGPANQIHGGGGNDRIATGGGQDLAYGGTGNDAMTGEMGDDSLWGDDGADKLTGGYGQDMLTGGSEADQFIFNTTNDSSGLLPDTITDFSTADGDLINLHMIDADTSLDGNQDFQLIDTAFTGRSGELRTEVQGTDLIVSVDTDGDGLADFDVLVKNISVLSFADFLL